MNNFENIDGDRKIDKLAVEASKEEFALEELIKLEMPFIRNCAGKSLLAHIGENSEEEIAAIEAFYEAVRSYSYEKGSFLSFASMVIKRRMIDYKRKKTRLNRVIVLEPEKLTKEKDQIESDSFESSFDKGSPLFDEISALSIELELYGFEFRDLVKASPKANKTVYACKEIITYILNNRIILEELRHKKMLPIKSIEKNTKIPRKIIERHRKYIIAVVEISVGDYPNLFYYVRSMIKER